MAEASTVNLVTGVRGADQLKVNSIMRRTTRWLACATMLALATAKTEAGMIDTESGWDHGYAVSSFGEPWAATYGQTFTVVGLETVLNSFSFWLDDLAYNPDAPDPTEFAAYVMAWDSGARHATGQILYQSAMQSTSNNHGLDGWEEFRFNTGNLSLTAGQQYVAFLSASSFFDDVNGQSAMGFRGADVYAGGQWVNMFNGSEFAMLTTNVWGNLAGQDAAFRMTFSTPVNVPEPSSIVLLMTGGVVGTIWYGRRRWSATLL
ncbi:MAG: PEP-CTERM sorting domain-containing protein [Planctomycetaceae bacterium]|nr:PEP-CTERM sorting domain-containing protein [Planctomycetaceae bacterium]